MGDGLLSEGRWPWWTRVQLRMEDPWAQELAGWTGGQGLSDRAGQPNARPRPVPTHDLEDRVSFLPSLMCPLPAVGQPQGGVKGGVGF